MNQRQPGVFITSLSRRIEQLKDYVAPGESDWSALLSPERLGPYIRASENISAAIELYEWNLQVSSAFFELLGIIEVCLRNAVVSELKLLELAGDADWTDIIQARLSARGLETFQRILDRTTTPAQLVTELPFEFWTFLFSRRYDMALWRPALRRVFRKSPSLTRGDVYLALTSLKDLRNRIAHHEPIYRMDLGHRLNDVYLVLGAINPLALRWSQRLSRVESLLEEKPLNGDSVEDELVSRG